MKFTKKLDDFLREREQNEEFSGVVRLTQNGRELFAGAYGYASRPWKIPNHLSLRFDTASMTKLFTAVAVLQLIDQGALAFDTPAIPYLGITDTPISDKVLVRHLLTHSSGIADDADEEAGEEYADLWKERPNYSIKETADLLSQFIHKKPNFLPGTGCRYNNVGFILLGLMIEKTTGVSYRAYVRQNIFAQAGMVDSDFLHMAGVYENVAESYTPLEKIEGEAVKWQRPIYMRPPIGSPDGYAYTTVKDMERFWNNVRDGRFFSSELTDAFQKPQIDYVEGNGFVYKYGFAVYFVLKEKEIQFFLGQGEDFGVSAKSVYFPSHDLLLVALANQGYCTWPIVWEVYRTLSTL